MKSWWLRIRNRLKKDEKCCEHPKHLTEVINNGGVYCTVCGQTNIYKEHYVRNSKGGISYIGDARACAKFINKRNGY